MHKILNKIKRFGILFRFDNSIQLLLNRLFWPGHGPLTYCLGGLEVFIDHSTGDQDGTRSCLVPGLYEPCFPAFSDLPENLIVLDLGANGGGFLLSLLHNGFGIRRAVAVELNPHTWSRLSLNLTRNIPEAPSRIVCINGAAGKEDGWIDVQLGRGSVGDSIHGGNTAGNIYRLPQFTLATLLSKFGEETTEVDLCKIDIEGAEYDFLRHCSTRDIRRCRHIIMEIHDVTGESGDDLKSLLFSHGFQEVLPHRPLVESNVFLFSRTDIPTNQI